MLKMNGSLLAMKGESAANEMVGISHAKLHEITLAGIGLGRVVEVKKLAKGTPEEL
jgi:16S rRNA (guanine527-N7)-methyltransferase